MEYQKIMKLISNTNNHSFKQGAKILADLNDDSRRTCNANSKIKFKTTMLKTNHCD